MTSEEQANAFAIIGDSLLGYLGADDLDGLDERITLAIRRARIDALEEVVGAIWARLNEIDQETQGTGHYQREGLSKALYLTRNLAPKEEPK